MCSKNAALAHWLYICCTMPLSEGLCVCVCMWERVCVCVIARVYKTVEYLLFLFIKKIFLTFWFQADFIELTINDKL